MAGEQRKSVALRPEAGLKRPNTTSRKLANMPLAVLLPRIGELKDVVVFAEEFEARLAELQEINVSSNDSEIDPEERRQRALEESMLNQAILWLSIQSSRE